VIILVGIATILGFWAYHDHSALWEAGSGEQEVTTLGATAVMMILINAEAWPTILEALQDKERLDKVSSEDKRAKKFVK
jgi:hypothetical protein